MVSRKNLMLLFILTALAVESKNPVIFTFGPYDLLNKKISAITGNILVDIVDDNLWKSFFEENVRFRLFLTVDKEGNILSVKNTSSAIPDSVVNKFMDVLKKNDTALYVYVGSQTYKDKIYYVRALEKLHSPYGVLFFFPGAILSREKGYNHKAIPSKAEIRELCKKYLTIELITPQSLELNRLLIND